MRKKQSKPRILTTPYPQTNVVICGVGGQGILLASDILCYAAMQEGFDVKKSEVHGMAQRGGSVITHVRFGAIVHSPLIEEGTADFILAFEKLEALRYAPYLKHDGTFVVNTLELPPTSVLMGIALYPGAIEKKLQKFGAVNLINANQIARELGNVRTANIVLLGGLAKYLHFKNLAWEEAIKKNVKERFQNLNIAAFEKGRAS